MKEIFCLVYQAGIANVFAEIPVRDTRTETGYYSDRVRVMQSDFRSCENFCRGLQRAGATVRVAWCNQAGDIKNESWHFYNFDNAPFSDKFASDFVPKNQEDQLEQDDLERAAVANDWEEHTL